VKQTAELTTVQMSPALALERAMTCRRAGVMLARVQPQDGEEAEVLRRLARSLRELAELLEAGE
jgi:hypothetical protein